MEVLCPDESLTRELACLVPLLEIEKFDLRTHQPPISLFLGGLVAALARIQPDHRQSLAWELVAVCACTAVIYMGGFRK